MDVIYATKEFIDKRLNIDVLYKDVISLSKQEEGEIYYTVNDNKNTY